ncbi:hypothetical protein [Rhodococcus sp. (in: high G+C Gram-positive bacteria)]|uniref:hypothetical protein n=1 Tax=Rhodococcus sp. TaxID=1831 RepID=UPI00388F3944
MTPASDPARILDTGAGGLTFFAEYLPCAHQLGIATSTTAESLRERYDEQRGLDLATLVADASDLGRLAGVLGGHVEDQSGHVRGLPGVWQGRAADTARSRLDAVIAQGWALQSGVDALSRALATAAADIAAIVGDKARVVGAFEGRLVGGRTADEVRVILAGASGGSGGPTPDQVAGWFPPADRGSGDPATTAEPCSRWLRETFTPEFGAAIDGVLRVCDDTDRTIRSVFDSLAASFGNIEDLGGAGDAFGGSVPGRIRSGFAPNVPSSGDGSDPVRAGVDLVVAAAGLAGAVLDLAGSGVRAATAMLDAATDAATPPDATPPAAPPDVEPSAAGPATPTARSEEPSPAHAVPVEPPVMDAPPDQLPTEHRSAVVTDGADSPPDPVGDEIHPPGTPASDIPPVAAAPASGRRDTSTSPAAPAAAETDRATGQPGDADGGVVLAEAGPL